MKKFVSVVLVLVMAFTLSIPAFAASSVTNSGSTSADDIATLTDQKISSTYGIPLSVLETLPKDIHTSLSNDVENIVNFSTQVSYIKISYTDTGESIASPATYQEYVRASMLRDTDENDWMRIHTTIIDKGSYGQISAAYTWLTRPNFRMNDVIGLSLTQGTIIDNTADGFYTYTTSQGSFTTDFTATPSKFDYEGHGLVRNVTLAKPDYPVNSDFLFMRVNIYKESGSEGLNGAYGHQRVSIALAPSFNIDRSGILSCVGINIGMTYDRFKGYTSINW